MNGWLVGWFDWLIGGCMVGWLAGRMIDWMVG